MAYQRKTADEWQMWSNYGYGWECELTEDTWPDMRQRLREYRENAPQGVYRAKKVRVPIEPEAYGLDMLPECEEQQ